MNYHPELYPFGLKVFWGDIEIWPVHLPYHGSSNTASARALCFRLKDTLAVMYFRLENPADIEGFYLDHWDFLYPSANGILA